MFCGEAFGAPSRPARIKEADLPMLGDAAAGSPTANGGEQCFIGGHSGTREGA